MAEIVEKNKDRYNNIACQAYGVCKRDSLTKTLQYISIYGLKLLSNK